MKIAKTKLIRRECSNCGYVEEREEELADEGVVRLDRDCPKCGKHELHVPGFMGTDAYPLSTGFVTGGS